MRWIDSHQHFWNFNEAEYGWLGPDQAVLRRDFTPNDLEREIQRVGIDGVVSVQVRQSLAETEWLLQLANQHAFIAGVVGWVPLTRKNVVAELERFAPDRKFRGVRHLLQDEADDDYMLRDDFNRGIAALRPFNLVYDIVIYERHLPQAIGLVDRHPQQVFVLDHLGKPRIKAHEFEPWRTHIRELARRPNVYCKVSGMVTEADHRTWTESRLWPYFDTVVHEFTPQRLMFGSDWPVCLLASSYTQWIESVDHWMEVLTEEEQARIFGGTAIEVYRL